MTLMVDEIRVWVVGWLDELCWVSVQTGDVRTFRRMAPSGAAMGPYEVSTAVVCRGIPGNTVHQDLESTHGIVNVFDKKQTTYGFQSQQLADGLKAGNQCIHGARDL
jgi:hypothetical protein